MDWRKEEGILRNSDGFGLGTVSERAVSGIRSCVRESVGRLKGILSCLGEGPGALRLGVLNFGSWAEPGAGELALACCVNVLIARKFFLDCFLSLNSLIYVTVLELKDLKRNSLFQFSHLLLSKKVR